MALDAILAASFHVLLLLPLIQFPDSCNVAYVAGSWHEVYWNRSTSTLTDTDSPCAVDICIQGMPEIYVNLLNFIWFSFLDECAVSRSLSLSLSLWVCVEILRMALQIQSSLCINYSQQERATKKGLGNGKGKVAVKERRFIITTTSCHRLVKHFIFIMAKVSTSRRPLFFFVFFYAVATFPLVSIHIFLGMDTAGFVELRSSKGLTRARSGTSCCLLFIK